MDDPMKYVFTTEDPRLHAFVVKEKLSPGWYFWDEASDWHGPYESAEYAVRMFERYCREVLGMSNIRDS